MYTKFKSYKMIITSKQLKKKDLYLKSIFFLKTKGYLLVRNVFTQQNYHEIKKTILEISKKYTNSKKNYKSIEDLNFHKSLIKLRKNNAKNFALFFDTLQTSVSLTRFWTNKKIIPVIEKIMQCKKKIYQQQTCF